MTERKSIIKVDVLDAGFQKLAKAMAKFRVDNQELAKELEKTSDAQEKVNTAKKKAAEATKEAIQNQKAETAEAKEARAVKEAEAKAAEKVYQAERKKFALQSAAIDRQRAMRADDIKHFRDAAKWTADIARNVASTAWSAAKWVALSSVASGFGLGGLAANASTVRRTAQGLGVNTGALRSASVNFGRFIDPQGALSNIADAQSDLSKRWIFNALGENVQGKNPGDILPEILPKLVDAFKAGGSTLQGAQARGLDQLVGIDDLRRLSALNEEELRKTIDAYQQDRAKLLEGDDVGRSWQEFLVSLHRVSQEIEVSLLKSLTKLTPYLTQFADGIAKAIDAFVSNGGLQKWIEAVGSGLERLGKYLGSKEFGEDVDKFMGAMHTMAKFLGKLFPSSAPDEWTKANVPDLPPDAKPKGKWEATAGVFGAVWDHMTGADKAKRVAALEGQYKLPDHILDKVWANESSRGKNPGTSSAGALGDWQFMPSTATEYGVTDRTDFHSSSDAAARKIRHLLDYYHGDQRKALAAYNWGEGNLDADIAKNGDKWAQNAPWETQAYLSRAGFKVVVENNTGGSAQATVAALAGN